MVKYYRRKSALDFAPYINHGPRITPTIMDILRFGSPANSTYERENQRPQESYGSRLPPSTGHERQSQASYESSNQPRQNPVDVSTAYINRLNANATQGVPSSSYFATPPFNPNTDSSSSRHFKPTPEQQPQGRVIT